MMRTSLIALVAARYYQAPSPATVPVAAPAANAMPYGAPVSYDVGQAYAFPSAPVAVPVAMPSASSSKGLPLMAGAAVGATVAVLFGGGRSRGAAPKPKPGAKAAPKKAAAKPAPKAAPKKAVARSAAAKKPAARAGGESTFWGVSRGVNSISRGIKPTAVSRPKPPGVTPSNDPFFNKTRGKGGIFPWITNEEGTYAKPLQLSAIDFTGDDADALIGWGAMPDSVKNLYNPRGRKGLFGGCITPAKVVQRSSFSRGDTSRGR